MGNHFFHKLVTSARLNIKLASWGYCVLVYDSAGEPAARPDDTFAAVPDCSGSEFEVTRATSCDDVPSLEKRSSMGYASSLTKSHIVLAMFGTVENFWYFISISEAAMSLSDCDDIPTEAETRSQVRRRRAVVTRRLVPLACFAPVLFASSSQERSRELSEEAFDNGMYIIRCGYFVVFLDCSPFIVFVVSDHLSNDPVATPFNTTGHQLKTLCRSIYAEERAQFLEPLKSSKYCCRTIDVCSLACVNRLLGCLQD